VIGVSASHKVEAPDTFEPRKNKIIDSELTRRLRKRRIQSVCQVCSPQDVRWPIVRHGGIAAERGKTAARHWPAGGCRLDRSSSPASATLTPWSVGSGRPQP